MRILPGLALLLSAAAGIAGAFVGCGSDARAMDACRTVESARCERGPECIPDFAGDSASCARFYDSQCGRGVQDTVKEPTKAELSACVDAIRNGACGVVIDPTSSDACKFLIANVPPPPAPDTGVAETEDAGDAGVD